MIRLNLFLNNPSLQLTPPILFIHLVLPTIIIYTILLYSSYMSTSLKRHVSSMRATMCPRIFVLACLAQYLNYSTCLRNSSLIEFNLSNYEFFYPIAYVSFSL